METLPKAVAVTKEPLYHWFGYYDMPCWSSDGRYLLSLGVDFEDRPPRPEDTAVIGMTDMETGEYIYLTTTRAFNWQQGAMLHWLPPEAHRKIIFNDREGEQFVSVVFDVFTKERQVLGRALSDVGERGSLGLALNFARIAQTRPGYGYVGLPDPWEDELHPSCDGVWGVDLCTGEDWLAVSMEEVYQFLERPSELDDAKMWFNHTLLNPSETRFAFLVRWRPRGARTWKTSMFTADPDGSNLKLLLDGGMVSHFDWRDDRRILVWARIAGQGDHFYLIDERSGDYEIVGAGLLVQDGHCCYSHNKRWILTDTYPSPPEYLRALKIYIPSEDREVIVGRYYSPPPFVGELRCDLHPRWSWDDRWICFDSVHEGHRQVYVVQVPELD
ncbi:MAG: hypothetical protein J7M05_05470 [Anaerolineae bacterium]|nr:hypothetical protein [Anaerolineae bacterium]